MAFAIRSKSCKLTFCQRQVGEWSVKLVFEKCTALKPTWQQMGYWDSRVEMETWKLVLASFTLTSKYITELIKRWHKCEPHVEEIWAYIKQFLILLHIIIMKSVYYSNFEDL